MISKARAAEIAIIYIRNDGGKGEPDEAGTAGWAIHPQLAPSTNDLVVDKTTPDAFENTNLATHLAELNLEKLCVVGMQSEMCVRTTCQKAVELGFKVVLVQDGHTTFDFEDAAAVETIRAVNLELSRIAEVKPAEELCLN